MGLLRGLFGGGPKYRGRHKLAPRGGGVHRGRAATPQPVVIAPWSQRGGYSGIGIPGGLGSLLAGPRVSAARRRVSPRDDAFKMFRW